MKVIDQYHEILTPISPGGVEELKRIELAARTCYKSEDKISEDETSAVKMVKMLIQSGHEAMLEHSSLTVKFVTDRATANEIVRHRMASYAQESTRYCNYSKDKFGKEITVVRPVFLNEDTIWQAANEEEWMTACGIAEQAYFMMLKQKCTPQDARAVLPQCLKTELIMTANYREWRHFLRLRTAEDAHPQIRDLAMGLLADLQMSIPVVFD